MAQTILSPVEIVPQAQETPFEQHQLVLTYLPDPAQNNRIVPVTGVVVAPGSLYCEVRIRNLEGETAVIVVLNSELVSR